MYTGGEVAVGLRPEAIREALAERASAERPQCVISGEIHLIESLGAEFLVHVSADFDGVPADDAPALSAPDAAPESVGQESLLVARIEAAPRAKLGEEIELLLDLTKLHFFDLESGEALREP